MSSIQQEIEKEAKALIDSICNYAINHKDDEDFYNNINEFYEWKIESLIEHMAEYRDNGISTFFCIEILKSLWALGDFAPLNNGTMNFFDALCPDNLYQMVQDISKDEYKRYEEKTGTEFYKLHEAEADDAPHKEYPFDVLSGRVVKK
ncbi:TPA: hypothetical protein ACU6IV_002264 [Pseudomonas aeruginosa]